MYVHFLELIGFCHYLFACKSVEQLISLAKVDARFTSISSQIQWAISQTRNGGSMFSQEWRLFDKQYFHDEIHVFVLYLSFFSDAFTVFIILLGDMHIFKSISHPLHSACDLHPWQCMCSYSTRYDLRSYHQHMNILFTSIGLK